MALSLPKLRLNEIAVKRRSAALISFNLARVASVDPSSTKKTLQVKSAPSSTDSNCTTRASSTVSSFRTGMTTARFCRAIRRFLLNARVLVG